MSILSLNEVAKRTNDSFDFNSPLIKLSSLPHKIEEHVVALKELDCKAQVGELYFQARCEAAKRVGFQQLTDLEIVCMLTGSEEKKVSKKSDTYYGKTKISGFYDHLYRKVFDAWMPTTVYYPSFWSFERVCVGPLSELKSPVIPYGVCLRIIELMKLNFFNCFLVFKTEGKNNPIITGVLTKGHFLSGAIVIPEEDHAYFFIAKW